MPHFPKRISLFSCKIPCENITNFDRQSLKSCCCHPVFTNNDDRSPLRMDQSCLSFPQFYKRIILQSTGGILFLKASTYQNILVCRTYDTQSSRLPRFSRPNTLTSRRATKNFFARARCKVANDVRPKTYQNTTVYGGVGTVICNC